MWRVKDIIFVEGSRFRVNDKVYELESINKFLSKAKKRRKIIIYNENMFNKQIDFKQNKNINEEEINKKITEEFGEDKSYLFNYRKNFKNKSINIYAIKAGVMVEALSAGAESIDVVPVQLILKKLIQREINKKSWNAIAKLGEYFYFLSVDSSVLKIGLVEKNYKNILTKINNLTELYLHENTGFLKTEIKNIEKVKSLKGDINERIIQKQRVCS